MTRNTAREIAAHLSYELSFTDKPVEELLDERLTPEAFAATGGGGFDCTRTLPTPSRRPTSPGW